MKNISHKDNWNGGREQFHVDPPPTLLIKSNNDDKLDKYCVKIKIA